MINFIHPNQITSIQSINTISSSAMPSRQMPVYNNSQVVVNSNNMINQQPQIIPQYIHRPITINGKNAMQPIYVQPNVVINGQINRIKSPI